jgi:hypothetical protein
MTVNHPALQSLDSIDWSALTHAYGSAEDVPDLLRRLAAGDEAEDDAGEDEFEAEDESALSDLWSCICHQGSVYPATVPAVPFLAEIAAAGVSTVGVLRLLGSIAQSVDPRDAVDPIGVRAAVDACLDLIVPMVEGPDPDTRAAAMFVLAHSGPVERVWPLLLDRWQVEADPAMRAEALHALIRLDSAAAADLAEEILDEKPTGTDGDGLLRVSAALAWIRAGRALDERVLAAGAAQIPDEVQLSHWHEGSDLFGLVVEEMAERYGTQAAIEFVVKALSAAHEGPAETARQRLWAARDLIVAYRSATAPLTKPIAGFFENPELAGDVLGLLTLIGPAAATDVVTQRLIDLTQGAAGSEDSGRSERLADEALACLISWRNPIAPSLLARDLADRPRALNTAAGLRGAGQSENPDLPFNSDLLAAIRHRLDESADVAGNADAPQPANIFARMARSNEPIQLAAILRSWGPAAEQAAPELIRHLGQYTLAMARALAVIRPQGPECVAALRNFAVEGRATDRIAVSEAIRALTGDSGPLLTAVLHGLTEGADSLRAAATAAANLPGDAAVLTPAIADALRANSAPTPSLPDHNARIRLARTLWQFTGEADQVIPVLRASLQLAGELYTGWTVAEAADAAAELGDKARDLLPAIEQALDDPIGCPAAARALLIIDPEGEWATVKREKLADLLTRTLTHSNSARAHQRALDVLEGFAATLPPAAADKLRALAEQDKRIHAAVIAPESLRTDEDLRARILALLQR